MVDTIKNISKVIKKDTIKNNSKVIKDTIKNIKKIFSKRKHINKCFKYINENIPELSFTDLEILYISNPCHCYLRNKWIKENKIKHICDCYACIGGDTIQFMALNNDCIIDSVQISDTKELKERLKRLKNNVKICSFLNSNVKVYSKSINDFIKKSKRFNTVDYLYCDPPWEDSNGNLYDCKELIKNLNNDIFNVLNIKKNKPKYICFKVPYNWFKFKNIFNYLNNYEYFISYPFFYKKYFFHIIKLK